MVSILENLYPENLLPDIWQNVGATIQGVFDRLNNSLAETVSSLEDLDSKVLGLDAEMQSWNTQLSTINIPGNIAEVSGGAASGIMPVSSMYGSQNGNQQEEDGSSFRKGINTFEAASKFGEDALDLTGHFIELGPKLTKLKNGLGIVNKIVDGAEGAGELLSATDGGVTIAEGVATGGEIMAGAAGVAEAAVGFGLPGLAIALGALVVGGIADYVMKPKKKHEAEPSSAQEMEQYYLAKEKDVQIRELIARFHAESSTDQLLVESIVMQPEMVRERELKAVEDVRYASADYMKKFAPTSDPEKTKKLENNILVNASSFVVADNLKANISTYSFGDISPGAKRPISDIDKNTSFFAYTSFATIDDNARSPDRIAQHPHNAFSAKPTKALPTKNIQPNTSGRVININLNKPMIDHFTINTNGMKEGINDFKLKVEEVLLEILNSANTIN